MPGGLNQKSALALNMSNESYEGNFFNVYMNQMVFLTYWRGEGLQIHIIRSYI